jgi:hypothetical protein
VRGYAASIRLKQLKDHIGAARVVAVRVVAVRVVAVRVGLCTSGCARRAVRVGLCASGCARRAVRVGLLERAPSLLFAHRTRSRLRSALPFPKPHRAL